MAFIPECCHVHASCKAFYKGNGPFPETCNHGIPIGRTGCMVTRHIRIKDFLDVKNAVLFSFCNKIWPHCHCPAAGAFETRGHKHIFTAGDYHSPSAGIPVLHGCRAFGAWRFFLRKVIPCVGNHTCFCVENRRTFCYTIHG